MTEITYYMSCGQYGDGKSVCLWRKEGNRSCKIARFQSDRAAMAFANEFNFPVGAGLEERFKKIKEDALNE